MEDISIIIPVRSDHLLPQAIASVPADVELIIALTSPLQEYVESVRELTSNRNVRLEITKKIGMPAGVNLGASVAKHEKIVILDSDCRLQPNALDSYSKALEHCAFVRGVTLVERDDYWSKIAALGTERLNRVFELTPRFFGPSIAFRKTEFFRYEGYDEQMIYGSCDHEFSLRLEKHHEPVCFEPAAVVIHQPLSFKIDTRSHIGYGRGMCYIDWKHGGRYGLSVCTKRLSLKELYTRARERGGMSVVRSILLGNLMLLGYLKEGRNLPNKLNNPNKP